jgi:hypothetical protein
VAVPLYPPRVGHQRPVHALRLAPCLSCRLMQAQH